MEQPEPQVRTVALEIRVHLVQRGQEEILVQSVEQVRQEMLGLQVHWEIQDQMDLLDWLGLKDKEGQVVQVGTQAQEAILVLWVIQEELVHRVHKEI